MMALPCKRLFLHLEVQLTAVGKLSNLPSPQANLTMNTLQEYKENLFGFFPGLGHWAFPKIISLKFSTYYLEWRYAAGRMRTRTQI